MGAAQEKIITFLLLSMMMAPVYAGAACRVLVVVGMDDERAIAAGQTSQEQVEIITGSANAALLRERLAAVNPDNLRAVFSFGVAGGLDPALQPGDLLMAEQVLMILPDEGQGASEILWPTDSNMLMAATLSAARSENIKLRKGLFLGTDTEARDQAPLAESSLRATSGAHIIDNESHIAAQYASEKGLPFAAIRSVSDRVDTPLPPAALLPLEADGSPDGMAITKSLLLHPLQIPAFIRTAYYYKQALDSLEQFHSLISFESLAAASNSGCRSAR